MSRAAEGERTWREGFASLELRAAGASDRWTLDVAVVLAVVSFAVVLTLFGPKIQVNEGRGWDGVEYSRWVQDFRGEILVRRTSPYQIQRILPAGLVAAAMRLWTNSPTVPQVIAAFQILNVLLLGAYAWIWLQIGRRLAWSTEVSLLGLTAGLLQFAVLRWGFYYPVLTDLFALTTSAAMVWCYLGGWSASLCGLTIAGAFIWPTLVYQGVVLLAFPMRTPAGPPRGRAQVWQLLLVVAATLVVIYFCNDHFNANTLGSAFIAAYLAYGAARLVDSQSLFQPTFYLRSLRWGWLLAAIVVLAAVKAWQHRIATGTFEWDMPSLLRVLYRASAAKPAVFVVSNAAFFGPIVLLAMAMWKDVCIAGRSLGLGMMSAVGLTLASSADSEARHSINFVPVVAVCLCAAMQGRPWPRWCTWTFVALALAMSKLWLPLEENPVATHAFQFPSQSLFMHLGPWMSWSMYWVQGAAWIAVFTLLAGMVGRRGLEEAP